MLNELALFAGAGGGILGSKLLGHRIVGYVEINEYRQKIIAQRISDGFFDEAPIFSNVQAFNRAGFAEQYQGVADIISGGFPCQDISCAGTRAGLSGHRSGLWFEMEATIRTVRPSYVFFENSPRLTVRGFDTILCALSKMGYDVAWGIVSAADAGAPHLRERIWALAANANSDKCPPRGEQQGRGYKQWQAIVANGGRKNTDTGRLRCKTRRDNNRQNVRAVHCSSGKDSWTDSHSPGVLSRHGDNGDVAVFGYIKGGLEKRGAIQPCKWWDAEPAVGRVAARVANRVDRIESIGDGQVPIVAASAFRILQSILGR